MLGSFINVDAAGFYDNTDKIIRVVLAVVTATGTVLLPILPINSQKVKLKA